MHSKKDDLQIFSKKKYIFSINPTQKPIRKYRIIERIPYFKYLDETLNLRGGEKMAQKYCMEKLERAYGRTYNTYSKICISIVFPYT